jgi:hypothetical protein
MNKIEIVRLLGVVATVELVFLSFTGCPGTPPATTPPSTTTPATAPVAFPCPTLPSLIRAGGCPGVGPGVDLTALKLTCKGAPTRTIGNISPVGGGTRISVVIPDGSTITTSAFLRAPLTCDLSPTANTITITFGVAYVGDLGPGTPICISQSKATFTQFMSSDPLTTIFQGPLKETIHLEIDRAVVASLSNAPPPDPRCPSWRQMP